MSGAINNSKKKLATNSITKDQSTLKSISEIEFCDLDQLIPFRDHPFKLYEGQRFIDMMESIRANGVISPIIVRPTVETNKYEILSGHNRAAAAKEAGFKSIPSIIQLDLTDDKALLIVTETNLIQRSFADLKHSERAIALATHYEAMKKNPGYRSDLFEEIEKITSTPMGQRLGTRDKLGGKYGLSKNTVARYLRIDKLITELKNRLDNDKIGMRVAVALSYLRVNEQNSVENLLAGGNKINIKQADILKAKSGVSKLSASEIEQLLEQESDSEKIGPVNLNERFLSRYFKSTQTAEEIKKIIKEALDQYLTK
ncbi:MAG: ParB N-terminal domain-containing protein [Prevotella sp.]|jgi:ParB family chromosome partitioning protein|nr:ParB N-terminal domain-containing protein [Prevotella sp.]